MRQHPDSFLLLSGCCVIVPISSGTHPGSPDLWHFDRLYVGLRQMFGWFRQLLSSARGAKKQLGNRGEIEAARFLEGLGYKILHRQLSGRFGELDLVALDKNTIVFVEVKTRSSLDAGHPTEAITPAKQAKMTRSALAFLKRQRWLNQRARFDVVAIIWPGQGLPPQIQHYINAFEPVGFGQMFS